MEYCCIFVTHGATVLRNIFNNTIIPLLRLHSTMKLSHVNTDI